MMWLKRMYARFWGTYVGQDVFGNMYYQRSTSLREKRWVLYHGLQEASKVPAEWHGWLHGTCSHPLSAGGRYVWQKNHRPNLSGVRLRLDSDHSTLGQRTKQSLGHTLRYQPWSPSSSTP